MDLCGDGSLPDYYLDASLAHSYIKSQLGAPTPAEYEKVVAENKRLADELDSAKQRIKELETQVCV